MECDLRLGEETYGGGLGFVGFGDSFEIWKELRTVSHWLYSWDNAMQL